MPEIVLPGTYIEVRAEGLISAGRVVTGNIGIVGTAAKGPMNEVKILGSLSEAREIFGESDEWIDGSKDELTLIRALELIYKNGGQTVYAVRTANLKEDTEKKLSRASYKLESGADKELLKLEASIPGTWGNNIEIKISDAGTAEPKDAGTAKPKTKKVELIYERIQESYEVQDAGDLAEQVNKKSALVKAAELNDANKVKLPDNVDKGKFDGGKDGANATKDDYQRSLILLENEIVNIVLLAGQDVSKNGMADALQGHLKTTAGIKRERIGIIGSGFTDGKEDLVQIVANIPNNEDGRLIYTAPGILATANGKQSRLPGGYLAAAVAGLIASLSVQASPTNKNLTIEGLTTEFNSSQLERLVISSVLAAEKRNGFRVVKGITTADSPWNQVTTRRIVDYAIYGVRSGCDPYIGKLNNERVRGAMKATLDAFLTRMVDDEALVSYKLDVSATRAQEIAGEAIVTMTLMPTFSIDFIKVTMYLS